MTPERLEAINKLAKGDPMVIGQELVKVINEHEAEIASLKAERERYIDSQVEWAVRLSRGTLLEFQTDEETARQRAKTYRGTLLCCDVLSTDWREVEA